jgi:hypothetical protein
MDDFLRRGFGSNFAFAFFLSPLGSVCSRCAIGCRSGDGGFCEAFLPHSLVSGEGVLKGSASSDDPTVALLGQLVASACLESAIETSFASNAQNCESDTCRYEFLRRMAMADHFVLGRCLSPERASTGTRP